MYLSTYNVTRTYAKKGIGPYLLCTNEVYVKFYDIILKPELSAAA